MTAMPDVDTTPPGPIDDETFAFEFDLQKNLVTDAVDRLQNMVDGMREGQIPPVRALFLIQTYAATTKTHIREILDDDDDFTDDEDGYGLGLVDGYGGVRMAAGGRRRRRGRRRVPPNAGYPIHGGPHEQVRQALDSMEDMSNKISTPKGPDRTEQIKNLTEAIKNARVIEDADLEATLRDELRAIMAPVPSAALTSVGASPMAGPPAEVQE